MISNDPSPSGRFPLNGGETGALIRAKDWSTSPLGPPEAWPTALKVAVNLMLRSPESMCLVWGTDLTFFYNDAYQPILGLRHPQALGASMPDVWHDVWDEIRPIVQKALDGEPSQYGDMPLRMTRFGEAEDTWWSFSYSPLCDEDGTVVGMFCVTSETTQRVISERSLKASEMELRLVADAMPVLVAFIDRDLVYRFANRAYEDWFFRPPEEVVGRNVLELVGEAGFEVRRAAFQQVLDGEPARLELEWPHADGRSRIADVRYLPRRGVDDVVDGFYVFVLDVSDRKRIETMLRESNRELEIRVEERTRQLDQVWRFSRDMLCVANFEARFVSLNPAWTQTLGWTVEDLMATSFVDFIHPDDRERTTEAMGGLSRGETVTGFENRYRHKDGDHRWLSWTAVPRDGLIYGVVRDVTREKAQASALVTAEEALRQAQKMEAIGQLTGGVAHDFNNLLTVIKSSTDLLKRPDLQEERRLRYVGAISDTVDRAAKLTGQLLAFARRQALKPEVFELGRSLTSIGDMVGTLTGSRIEVDVRIPAAACFVDADPSQFDTAIVNMVVNARDAMDGQGRLVIAMTEASGIPPVRVQAPASGAFVAVSITDTGGGIAQADMDRIFEPFFTTKGVGHGTGLGLSQVIGFAKQSGGDVHVESEIGHGTTFTLYLPRVADPVASAIPDVEPEPLVDGHGTRVLVVEDNVDVGKFATQALAELGYVTVWAANADEALIELSKGAERFDVVFSDVVMPGMDGIDLGHAIRRLYHDLPVVLTSGYSHVLAKNGTYGFELLHKPYSVEQLSRILRKVAMWRRRKTALGA
ncbi:PAS domain-containing protein [Methylobacterium sp. J-088]|uniref:PAS domain-containing protein n=1 Tax=Methylobacterium sp. J-088 TaxID=2836664 RepID=UPI001FB9F132|nr:PAS domain-containing protein [Methylobacterium sp. J-088]MCJ2066003.1 PAS domain-containing protein [Methylobacterium sp. J-088]